MLWINALTSTALRPVFAVAITFVGIIQGSAYGQATVAGGEPIDLLADGLSAWHIAGCEVSVEEGVLRLEEGDGFARVAWELRDFEFEFEWRPLKASKFDSGIYFRAPDPEGAPWPKQYQINLLEQGEGRLLGVEDGVPREGMVRAGEWNRMKLRVVGDQATLWINDEQAWQVSGISTAAGHLGLQSEVPQGGQFEFRSMRLTELDSTPMFQPNSLTGWTVVGDSDKPASWVAEDGLVRCLGGGGSWLRYEEPMADVNLRMEYRLPERGNSGIYVHVPEDGNHHGDGAGVEIQILDDAGHAADQLKDYQFSASLYDFAGAEPRISRPVGEWNIIELQVTGGRYRIRHNGETVVDVDSADLPALAARRTDGFLGLQNHGEAAEFRRVRWVN